MTNIDSCKNLPEGYSDLNKLCSIIGNQEITPKILFDNWNLLKKFYGYNGEISEIFEISDGKIKIISSKGKFYDNYGKDANGNLNENTFNDVKESLKKKKSGLPEDVVNLTINLIKVVFQGEINNLKDDIALSQGKIEDIYKKFDEAKRDFDRYARDIDAGVTDLFSSKYWLNDDEKKEKGMELNKRSSEVIKYIKLVKGHVNYTQWKNKEENGNKVNSEKNQELENYMIKIGDYYAGKDEIDNDHWQDSIKAMGLYFDVLGSKDKLGADFGFKPLPTTEEILKRFKSDSYSRKLLVEQLREGKSLGQIFDNPKIKGAWSKFYEEAFSEFEQINLTKINTFYDDSKGDSQGTRFTPDQKIALIRLQDMLNGGTSTMDLKDRHSKLIRAGLKFAPVVAVGLAASIPTMGSSNTIIGIAGGALLSGTAMTATQAVIDGNGDPTKLASELVLNSLTMSAGKAARFYTIGKTHLANPSFLRFTAGAVSEGMGDYVAGMISDGIRILFKDESFDLSDIAKNNLIWLLMPMFGVGIKGGKMMYTAMHERASRKAFETIQRYNALKILGEDALASAELNALKSEISKSQDVMRLDLKSTRESIENDIKAKRATDLKDAFDEVPNPTRSSKHINKLFEEELFLGDKIRLIDNSNNVTIMQITSWDISGNKITVSYRDVSGSIVDKEIKLSSNDKIILDKNDPLFAGFNIKNYGRNSHPDLERIKPILDEIVEKEQALKALNHLDNYLNDTSSIGLSYRSAILKNVDEVKLITNGLVDSIKNATSDIMIGKFKIVKNNNVYHLYDTSPGAPRSPIKSVKDPNKLVKFMYKEKDFNLLVELSGEQMIRLRLGSEIGKINTIEEIHRTIELEGKRIRFAYEDGKIVYDDVTDPLNISRLDLNATSNHPLSLLKSDLDTRLYLSIMEHLK